MNCVVCVHMDSKLEWNYHIDIGRNKVAKNVSVINRVKHVLTSSALYIPREPNLFFCGENGHSVL